MSARTAQLQIRVTPDEKAALRRLARAAGETISGYVLNRVLPSSELELARLMGALVDPTVDFRKPLSDLALALHELPDDTVTDGVPMPDAEIPLTHRNRIAALVESEAGRRGVEPPVWTREIPLPERPVFGWPLASLKPHQMRVTPAAFKRRNIFFDPEAGPAPDIVGAATTAQGSEPPKEVRLLARLDQELAARGLAAELYLLGGAVLAQGLAADPKTARISALFRPTDRVLGAVRAVAEAEGEPETWLHDAVRRALGRGPGGVVRPFLELRALRVFEPPPAYLLAMKCAAMPPSTGTSEEDDVRFLLRAMNLTSTDAALREIGRYVSERHLPTDLGARLGRLLSH